MSKVINVTVPKSKVRELAIFCDSLDIKIISQYSTESLFGDIEVHCILKVEGNEIPEALKEEKLRDKFGKFIKTEE